MTATTIPLDSEELRILHERIRSLTADLAVERQRVRDAHRSRAHVLALLAAVWPAARCRNDPSRPDTAMLYMSTLKGQLSWRIHPDDEGLLSHAPLVSSRSPRGKWDGHTTTEKHQRILRLLRTLHAGSLSARERS